MCPQGHPYRVPVKYKKTLSEPKFFSSVHPTIVRPSAVCCVAAWQSPLETALSHGCVSLLRSSLAQRIEFAGPGPAALSCRHPSGSRPRTLGAVHKGRAPFRPCRDQNNISTASGSIEGPSRDGPDISYDLPRGGAFSLLGLRKRAKEMPNNSDRFFMEFRQAAAVHSYLRVQASPSSKIDRRQRFAHPNTLVRSNGSCRFSI